MWNIVPLQGKNYLVDVTNSDSGMIGQNGELFLAGTDGNVNEGYTFNISGARISYVYKDDTKKLYRTEDLELADADYEEKSKIELQKEMIQISESDQLIYDGTIHKVFVDAGDGMLTENQDYLCDIKKRWKLSLRNQGGRRV